MGRQKKSLRANRKRNSYLIGIFMGVLMGLVFGYATDSLIVSVIVCGLLGYGLGHLIYKTIN